MDNLVCALISGFYKSITEGYEHMYTFPLLMLNHPSPLPSRWGVISISYLLYL